MADRLYLSLWFPNFRLDSLPPALISVMRQFAAAAGAPYVRAASAYPISWSENPSYQRIYGDAEVEESAPERAVPEAAALLHDDAAYEFEMRWDLWTVERSGGLDPHWKLEPSIVRITGFGPEFDDGAYQENGQIRVDFGVDTPFLQDELELDRRNAEYVKRNIEKLVAFTDAVQRNCGVSGRLLWSDAGDNLADKLIARLQRVN